MKKIHILYTFILLFFFNCNEEEYETPFGDFSSFNDIITKTQNNDGGYNANLNSYIAFYDLSKNEVSHSWSIPEGTALLDKTFTEADTIYTNFISEFGATTSNDELINVLFTEPGIKNIVLSNTYKDSIFNSIAQEDGSWLLEHNYTVTVFDDVKPAFQILKGEEVVLAISENDIPNIENEATWPTIIVEAGEELTFEDLTTSGTPNTRTWNFESGNITVSQAASVNVLYNSLGDFSIGSLTSRRTNTAGATTFATKLIPAKIEVVPSTKPFIITGDITEDETETLSFNVTGEVASIGVDEKYNFTVLVSNPAASFNQIIPVQSVQVNNNNATQIDLKLSAPIYNTDMVEISYIKGNIQSVDFRTLESFNNQTVIMNFQGAMNITGYTGYETVWSGAGNQFKKANTEGFWAQHNSTSASGPNYYFRDDTMAYGGNSSMKFETTSTGIPALARLQGGQYGNLSPLESGTYVPSVWVFIDPQSTITGFQYNFTTSAEGTFNFDITDVEKGTWVRLTLPEVTLPSLSAGRLDLNLTESDQSSVTVQKMWFDNFDLLILEER